MKVAQEEAMMAMAREIALELSDSGLDEEELVEEAYLGLAEAWHELGKDADQDAIDDRIREHMRQFIDEHNEAASSDDYLITQVQILNDSIEKLTQELGTRPNIDELANEMGIPQEKVIDILKLVGEDIEPLSDSKSKKSSFEWSADWKLKL